MQTPTLDDLVAQLVAQDVELTDAARVAETIPAELTVDESLLSAIDDATELRGGLGASPWPHLAPGIRA